MSSLTLSNLQLRQEGRLIAGADLHINAGEILCVMGPSGSGKTSLIKGILGVPNAVHELSGRVILGTRDVSALPLHQRRIGVLMQEPLLFSHLSVGGNLGFGLDPRLRGKARRDRIETALEAIGLPGFAQRDPASLSGGQRSRVALMRCLLAAPEAVLLDEPFASLDLALRDQMRELTFDHIRKAGLAAVLVTHDPMDAAAAGGRIISPQGQAWTGPDVKAPG